MVGGRLFVEFLVLTVDVVAWVVAVVAVVATRFECAGLVVLFLERAGSGA